MLVCTVLLVRSFLACLFFNWLFLPQLEVLMKLCRQFWNQTWFCQKIQRKQLTSRTPLKISVQLYFPWKYHRYDSHFTKSYFTKSINITIFFLLRFVYILYHTAAFPDVVAIILQKKSICYQNSQYASATRCYAMYGLSTNIFVANR